MTSVKFCKVCEENLWIQFFTRMNCIDNVNVETVGSDVKVSLTMVKIGQFRSGGPIDGEKFTFKWLKNGVHQVELDNKHEWTKSQNEVKGNWNVEAKYLTPEIRSDPNNVSLFKRSFLIN
jgi:hypothetical protein